MKIDRTIVLAAMVFSALAAGVVPLGSGGNQIGPSTAQAQNIGLRVVRGTVLIGENTPVPGATVFLKNEKTKTIRSYTSIANGHFYFAQVNMAEDFDLWAEKDGKKSETKTISSWDARKESVNDLKLK